MDFGWKHLPRNETSQNFILKTFYSKNKDTKKVKTFRKFTSSLHLIVLNKTKLSNLFLFHSILAFLADTIFSVLKSGLKLSMIGLRNVLIDIYFPIPQYIQWVTHQIFCVPDIQNSLNLSVILSLYCYWIGIKPFWRSETVF